MATKIYIGWDEFHQHCKNLVELLKEKGNFTKIVAVSRGGLVPAGILAYELNIRNCETINMSSYDDSPAAPDALRRDDAEIELHAAVSHVDGQTLIVDDLADTGRTFRILRQMYPQAVYCSVYAKEAGKNSVDVYTKELPEAWIVFPWDV